jgi:hypothetical protein
MSRSKPYGGATLLAAILALVTGVVLVACAQPVSPHPIDLTRVAVCPAEDGPGMTGPVPCVFDGKDASASAYGTRWVLYVADDVCPVETVQDVRLVRCVIRSDWTGGMGSGEGRI